MSWYACDFETDCSHFTEIKGKVVPDYTYVWAWGIIKVDDVKDGSKMLYGSNIVDFLNKVEDICKDGDTFWFHNLKFDGQFIAYEILCRQGYTVVTNPKDLINGSIYGLISSQGQWYSLQIKTMSGKTITINNSLLKLPFKISSIAKTLKMKVLKGSIDYTIRRSENHKLTKEEYDYLYNDCFILANALKQLFLDNNLKRLTIGSDCLKFFKDITPNYDTLFPKIDKEVDKYLRPAYKGGFCYKMPNAGHESNGSTFDYNSMYPSVMHSKLNYKYPYGKPIFYTGEYVPCSYDLYIQRFKCDLNIRDGYVPFIQLKHNPLFGEHEYITHCENVELTLCNVDFERLFEHYEVSNYEPLDGMMFQSKVGMFDKYINHFYDMKERATIENNPVERQLAKLFLNNLYGKFASRIENPKKIFKGLGNHNQIVFDMEDSESDGVYLPVGIFCTAYAREELIKGIQANYDSFCYCDTDSIHCNKPAKDVTGIVTHDSALGAWKCEGEWDRAIFLRQKTYMERIDGKWDIKCAGASEDVKKYITPENFKLGWQTPEPCKLLPYKCTGGVVLVPTVYKIKGG